MLPSNPHHSQREPNEIKKLTIDFDPGFSLRDALNVLFCHKWKIILFFCTVTSAISVSTYRMPYFYSSEAKIVVNAGRDPNSIAPILGPSQYLNQGQQERVNNEVIILKSRILAERVVTEIGYEHFFKKHKKVPEKPAEKNVSKIEENVSSDPPKKSENEPKKFDKDLWNIAVNQVAGGLTVELKPLSFVVGLTITLRDAELAKKVLQTLLDVYINRYIELSEAKSVDVFQKRYDHFKEEFLKKEEALNSFKIENNIVSLDEQKTMLISREGELIGALNAAATKSVMLKTKIADLEKLLPTYEEIIVSQTTEGKTNYVADALKNLLIKLKNQEIELTSRYPADSRKVIEVTEQIALVEKSLAEEPESKEELTKSLNQSYEHFSRQLEENKIDFRSNEASLSVMRAQLENYQKELEKLVSYELPLARLERAQEVAQKEYQEQAAILQKAGSYKALNDQKIVSIDIIEPPTYSDEAVKPDKPKNIILGIVLGLFGGIGLAFFLDYFDDSMKTNEDVKRHLKIPVLAMITTNEFEKIYNT
ncbi:MAG: hypothetical protein RIT27_241 [Pseudomonadota bacterium]|jgi:uncharacterized protein involved in exopolysaccharide biosynthesis